MVNLFIDTSILIDEIRRGSDLWVKIKKLAKQEKVVLMSSVVVLSELWAGQSMNKENSQSIVNNLVEIISFVEVDSNLAKMAGEIIRKHKTIGFDSVIAATCINYNGELVTLNKKHFEGINGLKLYNENL